MLQLYPDGLPCDTIVVSEYLIAACPYDEPDEKNTIEPIGALLKSVVFVANALKASLAE